MRTVRGWFRDTTGGLPSTFWYLWTGTLINRLGSFILVFLAIYLTTARGFTAVQAGLVIGLWGAGGAVGTMVGGVLADRWGRRPTLTAAHIGAAAMMLALGLAEQLWLVATGALLLGAFAEAARPAFSAMMIDVVPERDRLRAFTLNYWAINLGFACAAVLAGLAAELDYLLLFVVDATTTLLTAAIIFFKVRETRPVRVPQATGSAPTAPARGGLRTAFSDRVFLGFVALNLLTALVFLQHISMLPIAMGADGLPAATYGTVIALNGVLIVVGQLFIPRLIRGRRRSHVLALAAVIFGAGFGLTAVADHAWLYALTVLIWTLGEMLNSPSNSTLIAELSPSALRGRYQGVFSLSWSVAGFVAPIAGGFVRDHVGDAALWLGCAAIGAVVAIGHLVSGPARERRAAELRGAPATCDATPATPRSDAAAPPITGPTADAAVPAATRSPAETAADLTAVG
ncbi:Predicted arabinose efflux permease, MFS family [Micromonospora pattaloongensis]|uniref:Predicted arabinose efflux permease, MFS family n=1 Tax=Micromonospora pattaloongensis TaxID=405436 RepID=A0A1H3GWQ1_9ACTN|nr:MFS transporter [Micromonospora pattaloongensis]SDY06934.1 Predicted arabinose efflux permease, MFS family [Micromonospora pattaloongensis]